MNTESAEARLKRLTMRSWRRGMREMDLILGRFADRHLAAMAPPELEIYERLLDQIDPDLFAWISAQEPAPKALRALVARIAAHAGSG